MSANNFPNPDPPPIPGTPTANGYSGGTHNPPKRIEWAYGVTTVPERELTLLPRTLASLKAAGFNEPRLFVDGSDGGAGSHRHFNLPITFRGGPKVRPFGHWLLSMWELYVRQPSAARYVIFQDDLVCCRGLRDYLNRQHYPDGNCGRLKGYWNLYTFGDLAYNHTNRTRDLGTDGKGWYESNQCGWGGLALVFNREALYLLLTDSITFSKPTDLHRGWRALDGNAVEVLGYKHGWKELIHHPSLVQHTGLRSAMETQLTHPLAPNFAGEDFDAVTLLPGTRTGA